MLLMHQCEHLGVSINRNDPTAWANTLQQMRQGRAFPAAEIENDIARAYRHAIDECTLEGIPIPGEV